MTGDRRGRGLPPRHAALQHAQALAGRRQRSASTDRRRPASTDRRRPASTGVDRRRPASTDRRHVIGNLGNLSLRCQDCPRLFGSFCHCQAHCTLHAACGQVAQVIGAGHWRRSLARSLVIWALLSCARNPRWRGSAVHNVAGIPAYRILYILFNFFISL